MTLVKRLQAGVLPLAGVFGAVTLIGLAPGSTRAAPSAVRDVSFGCSNGRVCESAAGWGCCTYRDNHWVCDNNCKPASKEPELQGDECVVGIAPGDPIPDAIRKDLEQSQQAHQLQ